MILTIFDEILQDGLQTCLLFKENHIQNPTFCNAQVSSSWNKITALDSTQNGGQYLFVPCSLWPQTSFWDFVSSTCRFSVSFLLTSLSNTPTQHSYLLKHYPLLLMWCRWENRRVSFIYLFTHSLSIYWMPHMCKVVTTEGNQTLVLFLGCFWSSGEKELCRQVQSRATHCKE